MKVVLDCFLKIESGKCNEVINQVTGSCWRCFDALS